MKRLIFAFVVVIASASVPMRPANGEVSESQAEVDKHEGSTSVDGHSRRGYASRYDLATRQDLLLLR